MDKIFFEILEELTKLNASGKYTIFFDFAGHTQTIDIRIYKGNWSQNKKPIFDLSMIRYESPKHEYYDSDNFQRSFNPQTFLKYLADLWKFRPTKKHPFLNYSEYDK